MIASNPFSFFSRGNLGPNDGNSVSSVETVLAAPDAGLEWVKSVGPFFAVNMEEIGHAVATSTTLFISPSQGILKLPTAPCVKKCYGHTWYVRSSILLYQVRVFQISVVKIRMRACMQRQNPLKT